MDANKVVMATSSATSSVSCTATTVQSSNSQFRVSSKRPPSLGKALGRRGPWAGSAGLLLLPQHRPGPRSLGLAGDVPVINSHRRARPESTSPGTVALAPARASPPAPCLSSPMAGSLIGRGSCFLTCARVFSHQKAEASRSELVGLLPARDAAPAAAQITGTEAASLPLSCEHRKGFRAGRHQRPAAGVRGHGGCLPEASLGGLGQERWARPQHPGRQEALETLRRAGWGLCASCARTTQVDGAQVSILGGCWNLGCLSGDVAAPGSGSSAQGPSGGRGKRRRRPPPSTHQSRSHRRPDTAGASCAATREDPAQALQDSCRKLDLNFS